MTPEHPDNSHGRMLFTDFDVSDKGRPVAVLSPAPPEEQHRIPGSIAELASLIELDFEEDDDAPESWQKPSSPPEEKTGERSESGEQKEERPPLFQWPAPAHAPETGETQPAPAVPTWEEFANAFRSRTTRTFQRNDGNTNSVVDNDDNAVTNAPTAAYLAIADEEADRDDVDILSSLPPALDENAENNAGETAEDNAAYEREPGSESDPETAESRPARKPRPPLQAPETPYGGLARIEDWYAPPEDQPEQPIIPSDWFEPPEEMLDSVANSSRDDISDFLNSDLFNAGSMAGDSPRKAAKPEHGSDPFRAGTGTKAGTRAGTAARQAPSPADTMVDLFSNLDIDREWNARVDSGQSRAIQSSTAIIAKDTADMAGFFDGVDLEAALPPGRASRAASDTRIRSSKEETVILDGSSLGQSGFDIQPRKAKKTKTGTPEAAKPSAVEFLEDEPEDEQAAETKTKTRSRTASKTDSRTKTPPASPEPAPKAKSDEADYLDVMDDLDGGDAAADITAPAIDNSAIQQTRSRRKRQTKTAPIIPTIPEDIDDMGSPGEPSTVPAASAEPATAGALSEEDKEAADALFALDADAEKERTEFPTGPHVTTDDLLKDIDFDDIGVNAAVSAPVIDDSAIDASGSGPRSSTEEMQAVADGEFDEGDAADGAAEEAAPVNPADVFANMDDMDFSDDMDDDMRAMLDEGDEESEGGGVTVEGIDGVLDRQSAVLPEAPPKGLFAKMRYHAVRTWGRLMPMAFAQRLGKMVGWSENWWFYCDLLAAIIASASLAVIISYYVWYRK